MVPAGAAFTAIIIEATAFFNGYRLSVWRDINILELVDASNNQPLFSIKPIGAFVRANRPNLSPMSDANIERFAGQFLPSDFKILGRGWTIGKSAAQTNQGRCRTDQMKHFIPNNKLLLRRLYIADRN